MNTPDILNHIPLFKSLTSEEREELVTLLRIQRVKKGEVLFRKGSKGNVLYIIQEGVIKIVLSFKAGDERIITLLSKGDFFGEMSLIDGMPRPADAVALEPSKLFLLNRSDFLRFLNKNSGVMETILLSLSMRLVKADELLADSSFLPSRPSFQKSLSKSGIHSGIKPGIRFKTA